jgi:uncharacterized protein with PQ loop repeat
MSIPIHHIDKRRRIHNTSPLKKQYQPYPHPSKTGHALDGAVYLVGIMAPLVGSSQAIKIWTEHTASGVSLIMFGFNIVADIVLLAYGILHKATPIVLMYILWLIVNITIVAGIIVYG